jgi:hypothetical protein
MRQYKDLPMDLADALGIPKVFTLGVETSPYTALKENADLR